jgi:hypothetical protein
MHTPSRFPRLLHPWLWKIAIPLVVVTLFAVVRWLDPGAVTAMEVEPSRMSAQGPSPAVQGAPAGPAQTQQRDAFSRLPLAFEANQGQTDPQVRFIARGGGYGLFLTPTEAVMTLRRDTATPVRSEDRRAGAWPPPPAPAAVLRMRLVGASANPRVTGLEPLPGKVNYFIGNDSSRWRTDIPTYARVRYGGVYRGIDLLFYGNQGNLEYDLVVAPGANPRIIAIELAGAEAVRLNPRGDLEVDVAGARLVMRRPVVYQEIGGARRPVRAGYSLNALRQIGFDIGQYDPRRPLVIDPVLVYARRWNGWDTDEARGVAVDGASNAYVTGFTVAYNFPAANPSQFGTVVQGHWRCFVAKLNSAGNSVLYTTFIGADDSALGFAIAVDAAGSAYVAGAGGVGFPTTAGAVQKTDGSAFVTRLSPAGNVLLYSTRLGGSGGEIASSIAIRGGNAYVTGFTYSTDFRKGALPPVQSSLGGDADAFVVRLSPNGGNLLYSTYLGGSAYDGGTSIAIDAAGNAYVTGSTRSSNFPILNALQPTTAGGSDAFVAKLSVIGALVYSTYLGGSGDDEGAGIALDGARNAYVTGYTTSTNFPTMLAQQSGPGSTRQAFVSKVNPFGAALVYSTYLGGASQSHASSIAVDAGGNAYVAGVAASAGLPVKAPIQSAFGGGHDAFVAQLNLAGAVTFASYVGGVELESAHHIALDGLGSAFVVGTTFSSTPFQPFDPTWVSSPNADAFVARIAIPPPPALPCMDPPNTSMVAWYPFDEAGGTTAANLASGNSGTRIGGPTVIPGKVGNALRFDGLNDYVESPSTFLTNIGSAGLPQSCTGGWSTCRGDFSIDAWVRLQPSTSILTMPIVDKRGPGIVGVAGYGFGIRSGRLYLQMVRGPTSSGTVSYTSPPISALFDNQWHLVAVTVSRRGNPGGIRWYFDGSLIATSNPTAPPTQYGTMVNHGPLRIGRVSSSASTTWFRGDMDEVEVFNRVLSPEEVQRIYNAGSAGKCKDPTLLGPFGPRLFPDMVP